MRISDRKSAGKRAAGRTQGKSIGRWEARLRRLPAPRTKGGKTACFLAVNVIWILIFSYLLQQPSILEAELHQVQGKTNYDTIVVGDSHGETAVDPDVLDNALGTTSYNCARRIMPVKDIYYLMKEVAYKNSPKTILYEIDPFYWDVPGISLGNDTSIFFAGRDPKNKLDYFKNEMLSQPFMNAFADYRLAPRNAAQIPGTMYIKLQPAYWKHSEESIPMIMRALYLGQNYQYRGRGFRYGYSYSLRMDAKYKATKFRASRVVPENVEYFHKMAEFCKSRKIRLVCFYSALPPYRLLHENENAAHAYFSDLCNKEGVEYYDMNYLKAEYLTRTDADYVDLDGHMMGDLADRQTKVLAQILASADPGSMFVDSYEDVLRVLPKESSRPASVLELEAMLESEEETEPTTENTTESESHQGE